MRSGKELFRNRKDIMRNGKDFLALCFRDISSKDILEDESLQYNSLPEDLIIKLLERSQSRFSRSELRGQLNYLRNESSQYSNRWIEDQNKDALEPLDVFSVLFLYLSNILLVKGDTIVCRYEYFLHWRMLTLELHEDLLICAFLANYDSIEYITRRSLFDWPVVIGHNNTELNMILSRGMAENHFHLKGSAPAFHLAWSFLMNNAIGNKEHMLFEEIDRTRRTVSYGLSSRHGEDPLELQILQAAAIRVYLFARLNDICLGMPGEENEKIIKRFRSTEILRNIQSKGADVLRWINGLRMAYGYLGKELIRDYAVLEKNRSGGFVVHDGGSSNPENSMVFRGERRFMYLALQAIREGHTLTEKDINLFYAYLVIKERFRGEIHQLNKENVGFENFSIFEDRKSYFVESEDLVHAALQRPLYSGNIRYLEARICPCLSVEENKNLIDRLDRYINRKKGPYGAMPGEEESDYSLKYAYIMHFVKQKDDSLNKKNRIYNGFICRHDTLRKRLKEQANALVQLREHYPDQAKKVVGIDACNQEIGCRPEVFAPIFRMLKKHSVRSSNQNVPQLGITYHVGEDFLDPLDGLRAIYEAIRFLNMGCGDRLGHALALGIDVVEWYETKGDITLPCQDYLDNITWLYFALSDFNVSGFDNLKTHILDEFDEYFSRIYKYNMDTSYIHAIMNEAQEYYKTQKRFKYYYGGNLSYDIFKYHKASMLRGDDPKYYKRGYFRYSHFEDYRFEPHCINTEYPDDFSDRMIPEIALIYYYYHFDWAVKNEGAKNITKTVHRDYIKAVDLIQKKLQKMVAAMGISIEANPTSNYLISTFKNYYKHPITKWYNHSLETDPQKLSDCPQISVSINTDDMGVFTTSLSNEYSLMALALESVRDENNNRVYKKSNIYRWIDEIREFGLMQNFIRQNETSIENGAKNN